MNSSSQTVRVRFAPSPTGPLHIGGARTALFNYLFAKQNSGKFILRIDDTDTARSKPEFEENILAGLDWLGLKHDEIYHQSSPDRKRLYRTKLEELIAQDKAYISQEEIKKEGDRSEVIRLRNSGQKVTWQDLIKDEISFDTAELGDFVIAKSLDEPVYHFASVVDDMDLQITHVIRGEDHISNTPRQILIARALGAELPTYAHIPLILATDRSKLSKRHGATSVFDFKKLGYLPEAVINFIATLGWSPQAQKLEQEIFSLEELIKYFDLTKIQKSGAIFNLEKLNWFNKEYLKKLPESEQLEKIKQEHEFFATKPENIAPELLKNTEHLPAVIKILETILESDFADPEKIKSAIWDFASEKGRGEVLWPMRVALTGQAKSPDPFTVAAILGKTESLERLRRVI